MKKDEVIIRNTTSQDFEQIQVLHRKVYPADEEWTIEELDSHIKVFPEGQYVAEFDGKIVGTSSSFIIEWDEYGPDHDWVEVTGDGMFETHNPDGRTLYGAEVCVDPDIRRKGIGSKLYKARRELCRRFNLKRIIAAGRLPHYHKYVNKFDPHLYAMKVIWGDIYDPVLRFQISQGFQFCQIIHNYLKDDHESLDYAALICWLNEDYNPDKPTLKPKVKK